MKSRGKSLLKKHTSWKVAAKSFMLLLCDLGGLARKNIPRQLLFSRKAYRFLLAEPRSLLSRRVIVSENERTQRALRSWEEFTEMNHHYSWGISSQPLYLLNLYIFSTSPHRPKVSLLSPHKAEGLSAVSASYMYRLCGSISSAALREKYDVSAGKGFMPFPALGMRHPISLKYSCKCLIIKESIWSQ